MWCTLPLPGEFIKTSTTKWRLRDTRKLIFIIRRILFWLNSAASAFVMMMMVIMCWIVVGWVGDG